MFARFVRMAVLPLSNYVDSIKMMMIIIIINTFCTAP